MEQAADFGAECAALADLLDGLSAEDWTRKTQFQGWTVTDVMVHLHFWNKAADMSLTDPDFFPTAMGPVLRNIARRGFRAVEDVGVPQRGRALLEAWLDLATDMAGRWASVDPKTRVAWAGPDMSARSSITARQMETWAHGHEIFDLMGATRAETDRIRNIVVLGVNTFGWSHKVHGLPVPETMPELILTAPSGAEWRYGAPSETDRITGSALGFAQTVTQTRNVADTDLVVTGPVAQGWMETAQCFAGDPKSPPGPGSRYRQGT